MSIIECNIDFWEGWLDTFAISSGYAEDYWLTYCMGVEL